METQAPIIAFLYDFDKTLCTTDMEDYAFIPSLGYTPAEFWGRANAFGWENRMDGLLAYMYTMIQECAAQNIKLDRAFLNHCGESIQLFPGVREWFARINAFGEAAESLRNSGRSMPASSTTTKMATPAGPSWTSTLPIRPSLSTGSIRGFWMCPGIRN